MTEWLYFFSIVQGLFYFFICINLSKLNLQHLKGFKFDKMNMNPTILLLIDILSMYIAIKVFAVVKRNGLGWNVLRLTLKYSIFIVIICLIMFIVCKLLSFFDIMIVDRAMIILNDILLNTTFLNDLLLCFMIFAVFSKDTIATGITLRTTARTTKIHITSFWGSYHTNVFFTSRAVDANLSNNPATAMSIVGREEKQKAKRHTKGNNNQREAILNIKNNNKNRNQCCTTLICFVFFWLLFCFFFSFVFVLFFIRCYVLMSLFCFFFPFLFFVFFFNCAWLLRQQKTIRLSDQHGSTTYKCFMGLFWLCDAV